MRFPAFLRHVKAEGAQPDVVVRLSTFFELNVRVLSRIFEPSDSLGTNTVIFRMRNGFAAHPCHLPLYYGPLNADPFLGWDSDGPSC